MNRNKILGPALAAGLAAALALALPAWAGELEPSAPPAPTMQSLDDIPGSWSRILPADDSTTPDGCNSSRFKCVLGGQAVLDRETGLVWKRSASAGPTNWTSAMQICPSYSVGGRFGWSLPSVQQIGTLIDPAAGSAPYLPTGHPFTDVQSANYFSSTTQAELTTNVWVGGFGSGNVAVYAKSNSGYVLCVRGGSGLDAQ